MITLDEAKNIAESAHESFKTKYDSWFETEKAYIFSVSDYEGYGGFLMPFYITKKDGKVHFDYSQAMMMGTLGEDIAEGKL